MPTGLFDSKAITVLTNSMDLRAARHKLLTSNIANQETPGYRAVDINFEDELRRREGGAPFVDLARTSRGHMTGYYGSSAPRVLDRATDLPGFDGNSASMPRWRGFPRTRSCTPSRQGSSRASSTG